MSTSKGRSSVRKYTRIQPVGNKIRDHCVRILKILYKCDKSKNQIFNTLKKDEFKIPYQSDKSSTLEAIKYLGKSELVKESSKLHTNKSRKKRRMKTQKIIVECTQLGKELSQLIYYIDEFELSYRELKNKINFHFADCMLNLKPGVLRRRLQEKGWRLQEIENDNLIEGVFVLQTHLPLVFLNTILSRYLMIVYTYKPLNDLAKEILRKLIMDSMTMYFLDRLEGILADQINTKKSVEHNAFRTTYDLLSGSIEAYIGRHVDSYSKNRFIQSESFEVVKNLYHIQKPEENYLQSLLKRKTKNDPEVATFIQTLKSSLTLLREQHVFSD